MTLFSCVSDPSVTFTQQSELWLDSLKTRKRKPVSPATLRVFGSYVRRLTPMIGGMKHIYKDAGWPAQACPASLIIINLRLK